METEAGRPFGGLRHQRCASFIHRPREYVETEAGPFGGLRQYSSAQGVEDTVFLSSQGARVLEIRNREVKWDLTNTGSEPVTISGIWVYWPDANGNLRKIKIGPKTIFNDPQAPPEATIESGWHGPEGIVG